MPMMDLAIQNGLYLRALTKSETVALMASTLLEKYAEDKRFEDVVRLADVILEFFSRDLHALVWKGFAYDGITEREHVGSEAVRSS